MKPPQATENYRTIIVTRHRRLVNYLVEKGYVEKGTPCMAHVEEDDIRDAHVIGILPLHLARHTAYYTEVPLRIPYEKKGHELSVDEIGWYAQQPRTYVVKEIVE